MLLKNKEAFKNIQWEKSLLKNCKNNNNTKNTYIPFTQIHALLTFYHICFTIYSFSAYIYI